jgi:hypothetical protein
MRVTMRSFAGRSGKLYYGWDKGLARHGDVHEVLTEEQYPPANDADCYYQTNLMKPKFSDEGRDEWLGKYYKFIKKSNKPFIVSENTIFRRYMENYKRFGWNSYYWDEGNFNNDNVGPERWNKFEKRTGIAFKDWHSPGDYILIMAQKEGDSSLLRLYNAGYKSFYDWVVETIAEIRKHTDRPIVIRPHPRNLSRGVMYAEHRIDTLTRLGYKNICISSNLEVGFGGDGLTVDIQNAYCTVTYNSNSAVESMEEGIPTFALDPSSPIAPVAHTDLSEIENLNYAVDLQEWKNKVAYQVWHKEEVKRGDCWEHLKPVYFK